MLTGLGQKVSTHSRPKAAGMRARPIITAGKFQHTAARRRLGSVFSFVF